MSGKKCHAPAGLYAAKWEINIKSEEVMRGLELLDKEMPVFMPRKKKASAACYKTPYKTMFDARNHSFAINGNRRAYQCRICGLYHAGDYAEPAISDKKRTN